MLTTGLAAVPADAHHAGPQPGPINASNTYGWYPKKWQYHWNEIEDFRRWQIRARGSGWAYMRWGMIVLDSSVDRYLYPSRGSVHATLGRRGERYGRWEVRLRAPRWYADGRNSEIFAELVPSDPKKRHCGANNIAFAAFPAGGSQVKVFARHGGKQWTFTKRGMKLDRYSWHTYAVEVTPRRISWFIDAHVVATLRNRQAVSDVRLTPRLRLGGPAGVDMDRARIGVDWLRFFTLASPNDLSVRAPAPRATAYRGGC
jgi:Glycosyl hydrolases family 16